MKKQFKNYTKLLCVLMLLLVLYQSSIKAEEILIRDEAEKMELEMITEEIASENDYTVLDEEEATAITEEILEEASRVLIEEERQIRGDVDGIIQDEIQELQQTLISGEYEVLVPIEEVYINPLYRDIVSEDELIEADRYGISQLADTIEYVSADKAAESFREQMKQRLETIQVYVVTQDAGYSGLLSKVAQEALKHTGNPTEGDYLKWQYAGWKGGLSGYKTADTYYLTFTYTLTYYTNAEQEAELDDAVVSVLTALGLKDKDKSDYEIIKAVYDYICQNITYDYANLNNENYKLKFTAYAAMINKTSVCQGYAILFYRMILECGIDARLIPGIGNGGAHGWNIVKLGNYYYNMDTTWDASYYVTHQEYKYFLRCTANFGNHIRDEDYETDDFNNYYPMAATDYNAEHAHSPKEAVPENVKKATCIDDGFYDSVIYCSICDIELFRETCSIPATGHTEVIDPKEEAGCTETGKTEGSHCSVCEEVLKEQKVIPAIGHEFGTWVTTEEAVYDKEGLQERRCMNKGCNERETRFLYPEGWFCKNGHLYYYENNEQVIGWKLIGSTYYYMHEDGTMAAGEWIGNYYLKEDGAMTVSEWVDNDQYYVDENGLWVPGYSAVGWMQDGYGWWYRNADGTYPANCWMYMEGSWYYFWTTGYRAEGWALIGTSWYYFDLNSGRMLENEWLNDTYYFTSGGAMVTGWLYLDGEWYYMQSGGAKQTDWAYIGGYWYYLEPISGKMLTSQWIGNYYVKADGTMAMNEWVDNGQYYVDGSGIWVSGA